MNEVARHRPRSELVLGIQMENQQIRRLQAENRDLRMLIDEHQSAVDVIMTKYREQMALIAAAKKMNRHGNSQSAAYLDQALRKKRGKIEEMATVMRHAVDVDEGSDEKSEDAVTRLTRENQILREMLKICETSRPEIEVEGEETATATPAAATSTTTTIVVAETAPAQDDDTEKAVETGVLVSSSLAEPVEENKAEVKHSELILVEEGKKDNEEGKEEGKSSS